MRAGCGLRRRMVWIRGRGDRGGTVERSCGVDSAYCGVPGGRRVLCCVVVTDNRAAGAKDGSLAVAESDGGDGGDGGGGEAGDGGGGGRGGKTGVRGKEAKKAGEETGRDGRASRRVVGVGASVKAMSAEERTAWVRKMMTQTAGDDAGGGAAAGVRSSRIDLVRRRCHDLMEVFARNNDISGLMLVVAEMRRKSLAKRELPTAAAAPAPLPVRASLASSERPPTDECHHPRPSLQPAGRHHTSPRPPKESYAPDVTTYSILLASLLRNRLYDGAMAVLEQIERDGVQKDRRLLNLTARLYHLVKRPPEEIIALLETTRHSIPLDSRAYQLLIQAHARNHDLPAAMEVLDDAWRRRDTIQIPIPCYNTLLGALVRRRDIHAAEKLVEEMLARGIALTAITFNTLVFGYCLCGDLRMACATLDILRANYRRRLGDRVHGLSPVPYTMLMEGYNRRGRRLEVGVIFKLMCDEGVPPDGRAYAVMISSLAARGMLKEARRVFELAAVDVAGRPRLERHADPFRAMMKAYGKEGLVEEAQGVLDRMRALDVDVDEWAYQYLITAKVNAGDVDGGERELQDLRARSSAAVVTPAQRALRSHLQQTLQPPCDGDGAAAAAAVAQSVAVMSDLRRRRLVAPTARTQSPLFESYLTSMRFEDARRMSQQMLQDARRSSDSGLPVVAQSMLWSLAGRGDVDGVLEVLAELRTKRIGTGLKPLLAAYERNAAVSSEQLERQLEELQSAPEPGGFAFEALDAYTARNAVLLLALERGEAPERIRSLHAKLVADGVALKLKPFARMLRFHLVQGDDVSLGRLVEDAEMRSEHWSVLIEVLTKEARFALAVEKLAEAHRLGKHIGPRALYTIGRRLAAAGYGERVESLVLPRMPSEDARRWNLQAYAIGPGPDEVERFLAVARTMYEKGLPMDLEAVRAFVDGFHWRDTEGNWPRRDGWEEKVRRVRRLEECGVPLDPSAMNFCLQTYARKGRIHDAERYRQGLAAKGVALSPASYEALICGYGRHGSDVQRATAVFTSMVAKGVPMRMRTIHEMLQVMRSRRSLDGALRVAEATKRLRLDMDLYAYQLVVQIAASCRDAAVVERLFEECMAKKHEMEEDKVALTSIFNAKLQLDLSRTKRWDRAAHLQAALGEMQAAGIEPDSATFELQMSLHASLNDHDAVDRVFLEMKERGLRTPVRILLAVSTSLSEQGKVAQVRALEEEFLGRGDSVADASLASRVDLPSRFYDALVHAHLVQRDTPRAEAVLDEMRAQGIQPTAETFNTLLAPHAKRGDKERVERYLQEMNRAGIALNSRTQMLLQMTKLVAARTNAPHG